MENKDNFTFEDNNTEIVNNEAAPAEEVKAKKAKHTFTTGQIILSVVLTFIAALAVITTVVCSVNHINPVSYIAGETSKDKLVNKWQSQSAPGLSAYEFYDDGTYSSYISTFSFDGQYEVKGDRITITNGTTAQSVTYKYSIVGDVLSLTLIDENGTEFGDKGPVKYDRVDSLNQKSVNDLLESAKEKASAQNEEK